MASKIDRFTIPDNPNNGQLQGKMVCTHCKKDLIAYCISIPNIEDPAGGPFYALDVLHAAHANLKMREMKDLGIRYYQVGVDKLPLGMGRVAKQIHLLAQRLHKPD